MGRTEQALEAAVVAFQEEANLAAYLRAQDLAGDGWPELRTELLDRLRQAKAYYGAGPVEVFLHEGLIDDAIAAVDGGAPHTLVRRVVDAAIESHPDWAIERAAGRPSRSWRSGKAQYYDVACAVAEQGAKSSTGSRVEAGVVAYLEELIERHRRKYKLRRC